MLYAKCLLLLACQAAEAAGSLSRSCLCLLYLRTYLGAWMFIEMSILLWLNPAPSLEGSGFLCSFLTSPLSMSVSGGTVLFWNPWLLWTLQVNWSQTSSATQSSNSETLLWTRCDLHIFHGGDDNVTFCGMMTKQPKNLNLLFWVNPRRRKRCHPPQRLSPPIQSCPMVVT